MLSDRRGITIKEDIVLREEDEGSFLFNPNTGRICYLNELGTTVWRLCSKSKTTDQIIDEICSDYPEVSKEGISKDCLQFLQELEKMEFLSIEKEN